MNTVEYAPWKLKRIEKAKERQEDRWVSRSSPVIVKRLPFMCTTCGRYYRDDQEFCECGGQILLCK